MTTSRVLVSRAVFPEVIERLSQHFSVDCHPEDAPLPPAQLVARLADKVGATMTVLVDDIDEEGVRIARSYADAPDIDGLVFIADSDAEPGDFVEVEIVDADTHDLFAEAAPRG